MTSLSRRELIRAAALGSFLPLGLRPLYAADETEDTAKAVALLAKAAQTLTEVGTLTAQFETTTVYPTPYRDTQERGTVTLAHPGNVRIELDRWRRRTAKDNWEPTGNGNLSVLNATGLHTLIRHPKSQQYRPAPLGEPEAQLRSLDALQGYFKPSRRENAVLHYRGVEKWEGASYEVVEQVRGTERATLYIASDGLVQRSIVRRPAKDGGEIVREVVLRDLHLGAALPATAFDFTPPQDALSVAKDEDTPLLAIGTSTPDFTVEDVDGKPVRLSDFQGKAVVLKFWATWCWPCRQSLPETQQLAHHHADDVTVLAVALWDSQDAFRAWVKTEGKKYPNVRFAFDPKPQGEDTGSHLYGVSATPTTFVLNREGKVASVQSGYTGPTSDAELTAAIQRVLKPEA